MARPSLAQLNAEFAQHGFELVKGDGYFWFASTADAPDHALEILNPQSVMVCHFTHMPISRWRAAMAEVAEGLKRARQASAAQRREVAQMRAQP